MGSIPVCFFSYRVSILEHAIYTLTLIITINQRRDMKGTMLFVGVDLHQYGAFWKAKCLGFRVVNAANLK